MGDLKEKFLAKIESKGNKKTIENLVAFVIILVATIIFINYIWTGDKKRESANNGNTLAENESTNANINNASGVVTNNFSNTSTSLEKQIENILRKLDGVEDVNILITYSETNKLVPIYNEDNQESITKEEDTQGRN